MNAFKNFFHILRYYKSSTLLNIVGLAIAISVSYILLVIVNYDLNYNKDIKDAERVFRVETKLNNESYSYWICAPLARLISQDNPLVESAMLGHTKGRKMNHTFEKSPDNPVELIGSEYTEQAFDVLGFNILAGDIEKWKKRQVIGISESAARKFNLEMGDRLCWGTTYNSANAIEVGLIFEDFPYNSDMMGVEACYGPYFEDKLMVNNEWNNWNDPFYVKLKNKDDYKAFIDYAIAKCKENDLEYGKEEKNIKDFFRLTPLTETYFQTNIVSSDLKMGNITTTYTLLFIAVVILIIAFINFFNFFVSLIPQRIRSVNIQKIHGASTEKLRFNFVLESLVLILVSTSLSVLFVLVIEKTSLMDIIRCTISFDKNISVSILILSVSILAAVLIALYPAYYVTSFSPAFVLKGAFGATMKGRVFRYVLVGFQFIVSIVFIIVTLFVHLQYDYMLNRDIGFDKENILSLYAWPSSKIGVDLDSREAFAEKLKRDTRIVDVTYSRENLMVMDNTMNWGRTLGDDGDKINFRSFPVAHNFISFFGLDITNGRDFKISDEACENGVFIFNATAKEKFGATLDNMLSGHKNEKAEIVGFTSDFNYKSMQYPIEPMAFYVFGREPWRGKFGQCYIRIQEGCDATATIDYINSQIVEFDPSCEMRYFGIKTLNEEIKNLYSSESEQMKIITIFSIVSIIISLMGVLSLVLFETQYRRREIALRRINGANIESILSVFSFRFARVVVICYIVALPISIYLVDVWLQGFAYKTALSIWVFAVALVLVLVMTIIIVLGSSWKAANQNPIEVLNK